MTDSRSYVDLSIESHIARITLVNTARHNALTATDIDSFLNYLDRIQRDTGIRVLIITGSGDKTFCAGASLDQLSSGEMDGHRFERLTDRLAAMEIPIVAALNGSVYGGGAEIGLCCDFRIGVRGMVLRVPAARFGLCYPLNGIQRYVQRLGLNAAKRILVASEELGDSELLALGYLTRLAAPEQLTDTTEQLANSLCELGPLAVRAMKKLCDQTADGSLDTAQAVSIIQHCNQSADLQEGLAARAEDRKPIFKGC